MLVQYPCGCNQVGATLALCRSHRDDVQTLIIRAQQLDWLISHT